MKILIFISLLFIVFSCWIQEDTSKKNNTDSKQTLNNSKKKSIEQKIKTKTDKVQIWIDKCEKIEILSNSSEFGKLETEIKCIWNYDVKNLK